MTRILRGLLVPVALFALVYSAPRFAEASLVGDSVTCAGTFLACSSGTATVAPGPEFLLDVSGSVLFSADLEASSITLTALLPVNLLAFFASNATFGDLDSSAGDIVGVSVTTAGGVTGIVASDVTFTADSVFIDTRDSQWPVAGMAIISLTFDNVAVVPAPATLFLLGSVVASLGTVRMWRRQ